MTVRDSIDVLGGLAFLAAIVLLFVTRAMLASWWDTTWRLAVNPVRSEVYSARRSIALPVALMVVGRSAGCRLI